jgi:hypothetical protein
LQPVSFADGGDEVGEQFALGHHGKRREVVVTGTVDLNRAGLDVPFSVSSSGWAVIGISGVTRGRTDP